MLLSLFLSIASADETDRIIPHRVTEPIHVDGRLEEDAWVSAPFVDSFTSHKPSTGTSISGGRARVLFDDDALYVAIEVSAIDDVPLVETLVPRDETLFHDWVGVVLDTFQDGQQAFAFRATPAGVQADGVYTEYMDLWMHDLSWDGVFESAGQRTEAGYQVEMAIPWRTLRYRSAAAQEWGIIFVHFTPQPWGINTWPEVSRGGRILGQAGVLGPMELPDPGLQLEIQPTLTGIADPTDRSESQLDPGLGIKVGLTPGIVGDIAINPDFSQIEADAEQVAINVKYPLVYKEKRPFFLEGADLFTTPVDILYSRSMVDPLLGYKLTGRAGSTVLGWVGVYDENPAASSIYQDYASGEDLLTWDAETMEDRQALVHVGRFRYDLAPARSVGVLFTDKELMGDGEHLYNRVGGMDTSWSVGNATIVQAQVLGSQTTVTGGTALNGHALAVDVETRTNRIMSVVSQQWISPAFRAETGFLEEVGRAAGDAKLTVNFMDLGPARYFGPGLGASWNLTPEGALANAAVGPSVDALLGDRTYAQSSVTVGRERYQNTDFTVHKFAGFSKVDVTPNTQVRFFFNVSTQPHYAAESASDLYRGISALGSLKLGTQLFDRLTLDAGVLGQQFYKTLSAPAVYTTVIPRGEAGLNFSRELALRAITSWNSYAEVVENSALFSYELNYGTVFYLGYSGVMAEEDSHQLFAKVSWLGRP